MADAAIVTAMAQLRLILAGTVTSAQNLIPVGHFRATDNDVPLEDQPVSIFAEHPYEVEWTRRTYLTDMGPATTGSLIDSQVEAVIRVGYLEATGGRILTQNTIARDELAMRLALEDPQNWAQSTSGIVSVTCREASRTDADEEGRCFLEMRLSLIVYDSQPTTAI